MKAIWVWTSIRISLVLDLWYAICETESSQINFSNNINRLLATTTSYYCSLTVLIFVVETIELVLSAFCPTYALITKKWVCSLWNLIFSIIWEGPLYRLWFESLAAQTRCWQWMILYVRLVPCCRTKSPKKNYMASHGHLVGECLCYISWKSDQLLWYIYIY